MPRRPRSRPALLPTLALLALPLGVLAASPAPAQAQLGAVEAFAQRVSDLSFYFNLGTVANDDGALASELGGVKAFGVELLFEVTEVERPVPGAATPPPADSVRRVWTGMEVVRSAEGVDTIHTYEIERVPPPGPPMETVWVLEMGLGYGQAQGYELAAPELDMNVAIRDLPAVSLYANYEPWGNYFGLRTGFMRTQALQVVDAAGDTFTGEAEAFLFGALTGFAFPLADLWLFAETGYTLRSFPSVEWDGPTPFPSALPRELDVSGWFVSTGLQLPFN